jgi:hypothetical protein
MKVTNILIGVCQIWHLLKWFKIVNIIRFILFNTLEQYLASWWGKN